MPYHYSFMQSCGVYVWAGDYGVHYDFLVPASSKFNLVEIICALQSIVWCCAAQPNTERPLRLSHTEIEMLWHASIWTGNDLKGRQHSILDRGLCAVEIGIMRIGAEMEQEDESGHQGDFSYWRILKIVSRVFLQKVSIFGRSQELQLKTFGNCQRNF